MFEQIVSSWSPFTVPWVVLLELFFLPGNLQSLVGNDLLKPRILFLQVLQFAPRPVGGSFLGVGVIFHKSFFPSCEYTVRKAVLMQYGSNPFLAGLLQNSQFLVVSKFSSWVRHHIKNELCMD